MVFNTPLLEKLLIYVLIKLNILSLIYYVVNIKIKILLLIKIDPKLNWIFIDKCSNTKLKATDAF